MSSGRIHHWTGLVVTGVSGLGVSILAGPLAAGPFVAGALYGVLVTPDYDLLRLEGRGYIYVARLIHRQGCLGRLWLYYWRPYDWLLRHRSPWSHSWPVGTIVRLVYGLWPGLLLSFGAVVWQPWLWLAVLAGWLLFFCGQSVVDVTHLLFDKIDKRT